MVAFESQINLVELSASGTVVKTAGPPFTHKRWKFEPVLLLQREERILRMLEGTSAPKVISFDGVKLEMSYCGVPVCPTNIPPDWQQQITDLCGVLSDLKIIHRDIKSSNVLVNKGTLHLIDFGWALNPKENFFISPIELSRSFDPTLCYSNKKALSRLMEKLVLQRED